MQSIPENTISRDIMPTLERQFHYAPLGLVAIPTIDQANTETWAVFSLDWSVREAPKEILFQGAAADSCYDAQVSDGRIAQYNQLL